jgi:hypothetical protein
MDIPNGIRPGKCELHQEHRGSRARMDDTVPVKPPGIPAEIEERIERYLGGRR